MNKESWPYWMKGAVIGFIIGIIIFIASWYKWDSPFMFFLMLFLIWPGIILSDFLPLSLQSFRGGVPHLQNAPYINIIAYMIIGTIIGAIINIIIGRLDKIIRNRNSVSPPSL